ncbi:ABC transporter permease subunit [Ruminococcus albus]|uniref:ABC-type transport system involved in multi-copper enzyme maturation, permease component n=1 Tax=Ruminococcus albus TaxID=1264 RepID=A0A1I1QSE1_RUMAL|nr:ABC transporter permease subunit [Ruminococcus albus]SFD24955.1 ABC-type transport system involved in multi-copper enzyme maturation, permease component [Ruminococcus albus]
MIKLMKTNFYKMFHSWSFWLTLLLMPFINIMTMITKNEEYSGRVKESIYDKWSVIQCPETCFTHLSSFVFIAVLLIGMIIGDEYSSGAIRNKLVAGYSRIQLYTGYLLTSIVECFLVHIICTVVCYGICCTLYGYDGYFLTFVSMLVRSLAPAAALCVLTLFCIVAAGNRIIGMVAAILGDLIICLCYSANLSVYARLDNSEISEFSHKLYIIIDSLLPSFYSGWFVDPVDKAIDLRTAIQPSCGWCMITMTLFCITGYIIFEKKDMK